MKGKLITLVLGMLLLSANTSGAVPAGLPECTDSLNICTTNWATCQTNAQTSLSTCQANLVTCQATVTECVQKSTFPSWDKKLPCDSKDNCPRFEVLADWGNAAVLDKETGLVWEKSPHMNPSFWVDSSNLCSWFDCFNYCHELSVGGRFGWRLPMIQELASLGEKTGGSLSLPAGHPFIFDQMNVAFFWSSYNDAYNFNNSWAVSFGNGYMTYANKGSRYNAWCVRGGQGVNPQ